MAIEDSGYPAAQLATNLSEQGETRQAMEGAWGSYNSRAALKS